MDNEFKEFYKSSCSSLKKAEGEQWITTASGAHIMIGGDKAGGKNGKGDKNGKGGKDGKGESSQIDGYDALEMLQEDSSFKEIANLDWRELRMEEKVYVKLTTKISALAGKGFNFYDLGKGGDQLSLIAVKGKYPKLKQFEVSAKEVINEFEIEN